MGRRDKIRNILDVVRQAADAGNYTYRQHANQRQGERQITDAEVDYVLKHGHHEPSKDQFDSQAQTWKYAIKGTTIDGRKLRVVVVVEDGVVIITVIDLTADADRT